MSSPFNNGFRLGLETVVAGNSFDVRRKMEVAEKLSENIFNRDLKYHLGFLAAPAIYTAFCFSTVALATYLLLEYTK
ncbi:MAG: hypothetical protein AABX93_02020 [Nanoarchaeota archaeon]|mgnify:CR=1 FL=1